MVNGFEKYKKWTKVTHVHFVSYTNIWNIWMWIVDKIWIEWALTFSARAHIRYNWQGEAHWLNLITRQSILSTHLTFVLREVRFVCWSEGQMKAGPCLFSCADSRGKNILTTSLRILFFLKSYGVGKSDIKSMFSITQEITEQQQRDLRGWSWQQF